MNETTVVEHYLGGMNIVCKHCLSLNFNEEKTGKPDEFSRCCQKGQVKLEPLNDYPEYLKDLMMNKLPESTNFMNWIRAYNSSMAFASTGADIQSPPGNGPYCFRVCGQVVHRTGTIHPDESEERKFSQIYILDPDEAAYQRMQLPENKNCTEMLMRRIGEIMADNPWVKSAKMLHEVEKEAIEQAETDGIAPSKVFLAILQDNKSDPRRYNAPIVNEVAVVFQTTDGEPPFERDIIIHLRPDPSKPFEKIKRINILNQSLDALTYPIFFPTGQIGWHPNIPRVKKNAEQARVRVTMREYFSYRFSARAEFNPLLNGGKLTQQLMVDCYVRAESNDLKFIKDNQPKLRAEKYSGLMDHSNSDNNDNNEKVGKAVILPSSFQGSPRNMQQNYQDAMAIVTKFGKPDLFITMTCNPKWKEIVENLEPWQKVEHRPDLVARVFNLKLKNLLADICDKDKSIFGKVVAKIHVIEFQKRGLPHAHMLIILDKDDKLTTESDIDKIVRAEIPDKEKSPRLFEIVTKNMIHRKCEGNAKSPCRANGSLQGECMKGFPKKFQSTTAGTIDGFPRYQRREGMSATMPDGSCISNAWVVPYNPFLTLKYNCHINVEICSSIQSVKYLFKYVYKGHDCANICVTESFENDRDETKKYVDSRYVSAPEAIWRLFCMRMHDQSHTIYRLDVHLEDQQTVYFHEGQEKTALAKAATRHTKLTGWFELVKKLPKDHIARNYKYIEIPTHYVWVDKDRVWKKRERGGEKVIGRMYNVNFKDQERYFLRILLSHEVGAEGFKDLRTVKRGDDFVVLDTYFEAAKDKGYILDDSIWESTMDEAKVFQMPSQMRQLFAYICALGMLTDKMKLWNTYKKDMTEDFCIKLHDREVECTNCELYALKDIRDTLTLLNADYYKLGFPLLPSDLPDFNEISFNSLDEERIAKNLIDSLNPEQRNAFNQIIEAVNNVELKPKCFFLDGPGGSGKTYLYTTLIHYFQGRNEVVLPTASTGIAANLLIGGRTFHSMFKLPVPITETCVSGVKPNSQDARMIKSAQMIIIDECTMASCHGINTIDKLLKEVMGNDMPFGGKVTLLGGDFRQCLTIVPHAMRAGIIEACLHKSKSWGDFKKLSLVTNMRAVDPAYSEWLLKLGDGTLGNDCELGEDFIEIPKEYICEGDLITEIFGEKITVDNVASYAKRAILCPKNKDVDMINDEIISRMDGEERIYLSDDQVVTDDDGERANFPVEFLNSVNLSGFPPHKLKLKVGTIVMLIRNLNTRRGLCNGTRLIVRELGDHVIRADILTEDGIGRTVLIPRIDLRNDKDLPFELRRRQFPLKPAFAMTINKSQGQTLDKVGIYLSDPVFAHGQLYVAFSRVRRSCDVKVKIIETPEQGRLIEGSDAIFTKNIVFREIFDTNKKQRETDEMEVDDCEEMEVDDWEEMVVDDVVEM